MIPEEKLNYMKKAGYKKVTPEGVKNEAAKFNISDDEVSKFKYYRLLHNGDTMFYTEQYIENHSINELEKNFRKFDSY